MATKAARPVTRAVSTDPPKLEVDYWQSGRLPPNCLLRSKTEKGQKGQAGWNGDFAGYFNTNGGAAPKRSVYLTVCAGKWHVCAMNEGDTCICTGQAVYGRKYAFNKPGDGAKVQPCSVMQQSHSHTTDNHRAAFDRDSCCVKSHFVKHMAPNHAPQSSVVD